MLFSNKTIFYTLNGRFINTAFTNVDFEAVKYHAAISFGNAQFTVVANFGNKSFKFGIEDMLSNHYKDLYEEINKIDVDSKEIFELVHDYLIHSGYIGTLQAFEDDSSFTLIHQNNCERNQEHIKLNSLLKDSEFVAPRKNTLNPDLTSSAPLHSKANKQESTVKDDDKNSVVQWKEEVKETPTQPVDMWVDNENTNGKLRRIHVYINLYLVDAADVKVEEAKETKNADQEMPHAHHQETGMYT